MAHKKSVQPMTQNPIKLLKATARFLLGSALGFRDCDASTLDAFVEHGVFRSLDKGEMLMQQGAPFQSLCFIVRGSLETSLLRSDGHRHLVGFLQPGDIIGLIGLSDGLGHVHDVRGREMATAVLLIPKDLISHRRTLDPKLGLAFELQLACRSRLMYERLSANPSIPLEARLARLILALIGLYGTDSAEGIRLSMKISQVDLADWLGVSRQRINSAVQQLKINSLISLSYSTITVVNKQGLLQLSNHG
jgi:CRP/FNR family transcriptional regulator, cyclic AMP receptor protein